MNLKTTVSIIATLLLGAIFSQDTYARTYSRTPVGYSVTSPITLHIDITGEQFDPLSTCWGVEVIGDTFQTQQGFSLYSPPQLLTTTSIDMVVNLEVGDTISGITMFEGMTECNGSDNWSDWWQVEGDGGDYIMEVVSGGGGGGSWGTTTAGSAVNGAVLGASTSATGKLATIVPIGFAVLIGVTLAFWVFRKFKEIAQLKEQQKWDDYREVKKGYEEFYDDKLAREESWKKFDEDMENDQKKQLRAWDDFKTMLGNSSKR